MKQFLRSNYDLLYIVLALVLFILDWFFRSAFFQTASFLIIFTGFIFITFNILNYPKDERINYIALSSGYYSFMISLIAISLFSYLYRYFNLSLPLSDVLRYILVMMWCLFSIIFTITKRTI
jgi:hypothetical protein